MHGSRTATKQTPSSAPATPKVDRTDLGEYQLPFIMAQRASKKARVGGELIIATEAVETSALMSAATVPLSPITPKQSPLHLMPPSPAAGVAVSPTRKESYKDLITRAISSHPDKLMTLSDIYAWIVANIEAYRDQSHIPSTQGWKNAIRHTLSFYKCFKRVKRHPSIEKPSYWTIDYSDQQTVPPSATSTGPIPASPRTSTVTGLASATAATASAISLPTPTVATSVRAVPRETALEEHTRTRESATSANDLRAWAGNLRMRSDSNASKEEQCIQGLLLFRTSAGFSFLPQSSSESQPATTNSVTTTATILPKLPSSIWTVGERSSSVGDVVTYTSCGQVYRHETVSQSAAYIPASGRLENGIRTPGAPATGGASVTVVVDPAPTNGTVATMEREQIPQTQEQTLKQQRKPQLQKRYVEASSVTDFQPRQPPKQESVSYVQLIANAILATPEKRATLAQIYDWLVTNVAAFQGQGASPSSVGWKNAVRHTLSTRPFFKRVTCEEAFGRQKPAWWTVDVEAMTLASSLRQQQQSQMKLTKRRRNGHTVAQESVSAPGTATTSPPFGQAFGAGVSVIQHAKSESNAMIVEKSASESPEATRAAVAVGSGEIKWSGNAAVETEVVSSPEVASAVFRFPSSSVSSGATTSTLSSFKSEVMSPVTDVQKYGRSADVLAPEEMIKKAVFESATGLDMDVFDCLLKDVTFVLETISSWSSDMTPRDALILTLLRLRRQLSPGEQSQWPQPKRQMRRLYLQWLALLSSQLAPLIAWPDPDVFRVPPTYLTERLITLERIRTPEGVLGVLDIFTAQVLFDHGDECCRKTINAVIVYNFAGAVIYRSKNLYWLDCVNHTSAYQSGLRSTVEDCVERELKDKLATKSNRGRVLLAYKNADDILPRSVHVVRSKSVRNLLREKFGDRLLRFDILAKPIMLKRKGSSAVTVLSSLDDALTVCSGLLNMSPPIAWDEDSA